MARASQVKNYYTFIKGLITEASPLTFPEESSKDEENCILNLDGSRQRRPGLETHTVTTLSNPITTDDVYHVDEWRTANGNSENNFAVVQLGRYVYFFKQNDDDLSDDLIGQTVISGPSVGNTVNKGHVIDLVDIKTTSATEENVRNNKVDFSYGNGNLFIVGPYIQPVYVEYDSSTNEVSYREISIRARDLTGAKYVTGPDYNSLIDSHPSSAQITDEHIYNLLNQGWPESRINQFRSERGHYPANSNIYHVGLIVDPGNSEGLRHWKSEEVDIEAFGNTQAPRGHFLQNIFDTTESFTLARAVVPTSVSYDDTNDQLTFNLDEVHGISAGSGGSITFRDTVVEYSDGTSLQTLPLDGESFTEGVDLTIVDSDTITIDRSLIAYDNGETLEGVSGNPGYIEVDSVVAPAGDTTDRRPETIVFYAGRVWYSGIEAGYLSSKIFFSQTILNERQYGHCYQAADPTSGEINDLVDTDGGEINIPEMGKPLKMMVVGSNLIIIADNGIWQISGTSGSFKATDFSIRQIMEDKIRSPNAVISAEGTPFLWTDTGIYTLTQDQISGFLSPQNISVQSVQGKFKSIPQASREAVQGVYDSIDKIVYWLYNDGSSGNSDVKRFNSILGFDIRLSTYFQWTIDNSESFIAGGVNSVEVSEGRKKIQFLVITPDSGLTGDNIAEDITFGTFSDNSFYDFTNKNFVSFLETGHDTLGDTIRDKQALFVETYFNRTEDGYTTDSNGNLAFTNPSSCFMTVKWEWSDSGNSGREHGPYQVYRFRRNYIPSGVSDPYDYGFEVVHTRNKIRGKGKSVRLRFESEEGKDFHLLGWSIPFTANSSG